MGIKLFALCVTSIFCVGYVAGNEHCYNNVVSACRPIGSIGDLGGKVEVPHCNSSYGAFKGDELLVNVQKYANTHILRSFQFLLMSSHFGNFAKNRGGFEKLYRQLSDKTWEQAIDLVKFIGKRGGHMDFNKRDDEERNKKIVFEMYELESMAVALDMQKGLAEKAFFIHHEVTRNKEHDPEVASYLENNFVHQHSEIIRKLSGHTNDLKQLIANEADPSLSLYLFDDFLLKSS